MAWRVQCRSFLHDLGMVVGYNRGPCESKGFVAEEELNGAIAELGGVKRDPSTAPRSTPARWEERREAPVGMTRHGWRMRGASDRGHGEQNEVALRAKQWRS